MANIEGEYSPNPEEISRIAKIAEGYDTDLYKNKPVSVRLGLHSEIARPIDESERTPQEASRLIKAITFVTMYNQDHQRRYEGGPDVIRDVVIGIDTGTTPISKDMPTFEHDLVGLIHELHGVAQGLGIEIPERGQQANENAA